jgi:hypothetical protein
MQVLHRPETNGVVVVPQKNVMHGVADLRTGTRDLQLVAVVAGVTKSATPGAAMIGAKRSVIVRVVISMTVHRRRETSTERHVIVT